MIDKEKSEMYERRTGVTGMYGQLYEIKLLMIMILQETKKWEKEEIVSFHLATNDKQAGDFDDVVFTYNYLDENGVYKSKVIFLQAKHKENPENAKEKITLDRLLAEPYKKDAFTLKYYFASYRNVKEEFENKYSPFGYKFEQCDFIIYSNALAQSNFTENANILKIESEQNYILNFRPNNYYYKLIFGEDRQINEKIINVLRNTSECTILAKELVKSIFSPNGLNVDRGILRSYHYPLVNEVIEKNTRGEGKLRDIFLCTTNSSPFKTAFLEEILKSEKYRGQSADLLHIQLKDLSFKLPNNFGDIKENECKLRLPDDDVKNEEIEEFLGKLKLYFEQPNESELDEIIKGKIHSIYRLEESEATHVFSAVKNKVEKWWREGNTYIRENNTIYQDALKISIQFDVKDPTELFVGRKKELNGLHEKIQSGLQMICVCGPEGVGKTELVKQYIEKYSDFYDNNVIWLNAENDETLANSFYTLASDKLKIDASSDVGTVVQEVYRILEDRKCLFVFDNAENNATFNSVLQANISTSELHKPYTVITSRSNEWKDKEIINLTELPAEDAQEFIKRGLKIEDISQDGTIKELVNKVERLPASLKQIINYIDNENVTDEYTIDDYLQDFREKIVQ